MLQNDGHDKPAEFGKCSWIDKRNSLRRPRNESARIVVNENCAIDCLLVNLSETGACLEIQSIVGIPEVFQLMINGDRILRTCHFRWALEGRVGVKFLRSEPIN